MRSTPLLCSTGIFLFSLPLLSGCATSNQPTRRIASSTNSIPAYQIPDPAGAEVTDRVKQLTGLSVPNERGGAEDLPELADPSLTVRSDGSVIVSGTSGVDSNGYESVLYWPSLNALVRGEPGDRQSIRLLEEVRAPDGSIETVPLTPDETPWDLETYTISGKKYAFAGMMTPPPGKTHATGNENISRRIRVATTPDDGATWIFKKDPVFGKVSFTNWVGHSYGHQLIKDPETGDLILFHDMISSIVDEESRKPVTKGGVTETELFARILDPQNPLKTLATVPPRSGAHEVSLPTGESAYKILGVEDLPPESTHRSGGGYLLEGARPRKIDVPIDGGGKKSIYLVLFSTGDYPMKNYTIRAAVSDHLLGPYAVYKENGMPADLGADLKEKMGLHALGRGFSFDYEGKPWIIFHAEPDRPGEDYTHTWRNVNRNLYIAPLNIHFTSSGVLKIRIVDGL